MTKVSFNPEALGRIVTDHGRDVRKPNTGCAFEPVVVFTPGIEAIYEGLRLANIECPEGIEAGLTAKDINPGDGIELDP